MDRFHRWCLRTGHGRHAIQDEIVPWVPDVLSTQVPQLTAIGIDPNLTHRLPDRFAGTTVTGVRGGATAMPFPDGGLSGAVSFTILHHVLAETMALVDHDTFTGRLEAAGSEPVEVAAGRGAFRFRAATPATTTAIP